jgi:hypothetical protein
MQAFAGVCRRAFARAWRISHESGNVR